MPRRLSLFATGAILGVLAVVLHRELVDRLECRGCIPESEWDTE